MTYISLYDLIFSCYLRENDFHLQTHWRVDRNNITQVSNGKLLSNSSYSFGKFHELISLITLHEYAVNSVANHSLTLVQNPRKVSIR